VSDNLAMTAPATKNAPEQVLQTPAELVNQLENRLEFKKAELRDLATMGAIITSIHDISAILSVVLDMAVRLVKGEVGIILIDENGRLNARSSWGISEEFIHSLKYKDSLDLPTYVFQKKEIVILNHLNRKNEDGLLVESVICLPIKTSSECYGALTIINKEDRGVFDQEDKEILEMLLNFVAVAINNSILVKTKLAKQKMEQEIAIARQIQNTMLPSNIDDTTGVQIGAEYFPVGEVGGDFYDIIRIKENELVVIIGDVSSKGVPAALVMSAAAGIIKSVLTDKPAVAMNELASEVNDILAQGIIKDREMFVTLFFGRFDLKNRILTYCNAGHLPGLFWNAQLNSVERLAEGGSLVGQFEGARYGMGEKKLCADCRLFLFTDGLTEAADNKNNLFGVKRAEELFRSGIELHPKDFCRRVKATIDDFRVGCSEETLDDFTILQVQIEK